MIAAAVISIVSIIMLFYSGLNYTIDFRGGTIVVLRLAKTEDVAAIRSAFTRLGLGEVSVETLGSPRDIAVSLVGATWNDDMRRRVQALLDHDFAGAEIRGIEVIGPRVSSELFLSGQVAIGLALGSSLVWTWFRLGWQFGAALALAHVLQLAQLFGLYAVTQLPFGLEAFLVVLVLIVFSLAQMLVIFNRIRLLQRRETLALHEAADLGVKQTVLRVGTIALVAVVVGIAISRSPVIAMVGVIVGTLMSTLVAPAIFTFLMEPFPKTRSTPSS